MDRTTAYYYAQPGQAKARKKQEVEKLTEALTHLKKAHDLIYALDGGEELDQAKAFISLAHERVNGVRAWKGKAANKALPGFHTIDAELDEALDVEVDDDDIEF